MLRKTPWKICGVFVISTLMMSLFQILLDNSPCLCPTIHGRRFPEKRSQKESQRNGGQTSCQSCVWFQNGSTLPKLSHVFTSSPSSTTSPWKRNVPSPWIPFQGTQSNWPITSVEPPGGSTQWLRNFTNQTVDAKYGYELCHQRTAQVSTLLFAIVFSETDGTTETRPEVVWSWGNSSKCDNKFPGTFCAKWTNQKMIILLKLDVTIVYLLTYLCIYICTYLYSCYL